jgi:hypothetical protein
VQQGDAPWRAQLGQRRFQLHSLVQGLLDEQLDRGFAPGTERTAAKAAGKALGTGDAHALDLAGLAIEHAHAGVLESVRHDLRRADS